MQFPKWLYIAHQWRYPKAFVGILVVEFLLTIACLTLYGLADPDTYRFKLWQDGGDHHFNSSPIVLAYAAANYKPIREPLVWSNQLVQFDIAISVLSMFVLLVKTVMFITKLFLPIVSVIVHIPLIALYATSLTWQTTPDTADPANPQVGLPWYISKGCSYASPGNYGYCMQARAVFAVTIVMIGLFSVYEIWSLYNLVPTREERLQIDENREDKREWDVEMKQYKNYGGPEADRKRREEARAQFLNLPKTPMSPSFSLRNAMTPRTSAFTQLNGGEPPSRTTGSLPFRQQWGDSTTPQYK